MPAGWNPFVDADLLERQVQWLRRAGAAVDGSTPFHVALRKLIVAGLPAGAAAGRSPGCGTPSRGLLTVCRSSTDQLAAWAGDDGFVLRWSMTRPERGVDNLGADVAAPLGLLPRHPRAAALRGAVRRPARCSLQAL